MTPSVYIIHGWGGYPEKNWFPWLKSELKKKDIDVFVPEMPNSQYPDLKDWMQTLNDQIQFNQPVIFVGHSLGVISLLRFIEELGDNQQIEGFISVCGFHNINLGIEEIETFVQEPINFYKIKNQIRKSYIITSDDDPYVPASCGYHLQEHLNGEITIIPGGKHLNESAGYLDLPIVLDKIDEIVKSIKN
jgi:hypothetical protein